MNSIIEFKKIQNLSVLKIYILATSYTITATEESLI